jgi:hypothetical protein
MTFGDNDKAIFGAGSDLQIFHDGSNSYVQDAGDGALILNTTNGGGVYVYSAGETMATFNSNGAVNLYYDNAAKLATTATGIDVTGTVTADGLSLDNAQYINFKNSSNVSTRSLGINVANTFYIGGIDADIGDILFVDGGATRASFANGGDISFYEDTGTTAKFFWDASAETISIGTGTSSTATISAFSRTVSASLPSALRIIENTGASSYWDIGSDGGASPNLKFYVNANTTPKVTFTSSGNVDIAGTVTADGLTVDGDATITSASTNSTGFTIGNTAASGVNWTLYSSGGGPTVAGSFGIYNNSTSTNALILSASNNLGLGVAPSAWSQGSAFELLAPGMGLWNGSGSPSSIYMTSNAYFNGGFKYGGNGEASHYYQYLGQHVWSTATSGTAGNAISFTQAMTLDTSGNLLVGKTATAFGTAGIEARAGGTLWATASGTNAASFNRLTNDGDIAIFAKDGTAVGSIGTYVNLPYIGKSDVNLLFDPAGPHVIPRGTNGGARDGAINLGSSSNRFNNLYLSGTIALTTADNASAANIFVSPSTDFLYLEHPANGMIFRNTSGAERMRIDSSGSLLVGTTSASSWKLAAVGSLPAHFTADSAAISPTYGGVVFYRPTKTSGNGNGFAFNLDDFDDTEVEYGYIGAIISGNTVGAQSGDLLFAPMSSGTRTERMRLNSSGNLLVGTTDSIIWNDTSGEGVVIGPNAIQVARASDVCLLLNRQSTDGVVQLFASRGVQVGDITVGVSSTAYNTSSDQRLKENITDANDAGDKIDAIKVRQYDWKVNGSHQDYGMVAQELMTVAPEVVSVPEDPEKMMGVDYSKLVPMMLKEIQSLRARVAQLEGAN